MSEQTAIRWEQDADNIVTLILDDPNQSANTMNELYGKSMAATVERLEKEKDNIAGVIITSAKKTFFAGGHEVRSTNSSPVLSSFSSSTFRNASRASPLGKADLGMTEKLRFVM